MNKFCMTLLVSMLLSPIVFAKAIQGQIVLSEELEKQAKTDGVLFVFVREKGALRGPPIAVIREANPKFPYKFKLGAENAMVPGTEFKGPFTLSAKLTSHGNASQKTNVIMGTLNPEQGIPEGSKDLKVVLDIKR